VLIDSKHRKWAVGTLMALAGSTALYVPYHLSSPHGPTGGSFLGLSFGIAGFGLMVFAGLLSMRKKFPVWRIGRTQSWMRGHLWLGLLSFPLILFHSGFEFGGPLTTVLMVLFIVVIVSGVLGSALQHYMPRYMMRELTVETVFEQIEHIQSQLSGEAEELVEAACYPRSLAAVTGVAHRSQAALPDEQEMEEKDAKQLRELHQDVVRPYLAGQPEGRSLLAEARYAKAFFDQFRTLLPPALHPVVNDLESICDERRQLDRQRRLHYLLHGWLMVHLPLSFALLALSVVHVFVSLMY
jgi:hypothetical protein